MAPAFQSVLGKYYFDESVQRSATDLIKEGVADLIEFISTTPLIKEENIRQEYIEKLKTIKLSVMFPEETLSETKINEIYEELPLNGTESFVEIDYETFRYQNKLIREKEGWVKTLITIANNSRIKYLYEENILSKFACFFFMFFINFYFSLQMFLTSSRCIRSSIQTDRGSSTWPHSTTKLLVKSPKL